MSSTDVPIRGDTVTVGDEELRIVVGGQGSAGMAGGIREVDGQDRTGVVALDAASGDPIAGFDAAATLPLRVRR